MPETSNRIENFQLENGMNVPSVEGRLFCSRRDPVKESEDWYRRHEISIRSSRRVLVLGLGAGFHLLQFDPNQEVFVLELKPELIDIFKSRPHPIQPRVRFLSPDEDIEATVLEFRPAWTGNEAIYESLSVKLKNKTGDSLQKAAEKKELWILAEALKGSSLPENLELTVKEIANLFPLENQSQEAKIWRALRELVL